MREIVEGVVFGMCSTCLCALRGFRTRANWADASSVERGQDLPNAHGFVISRYGEGGYLITQEAPPNDVACFDPDLYFVVRLDGAHYELTTEASKETSRRRSETPRLIRGRHRPVARHSSVPDISRGNPTPKNAPPEFGAVGGY